MSTKTFKSLKAEQIQVTKRACKRFELISHDIKIPKLKYLHQSLNLIYIIKKTREKYIIIKNINVVLLLW